MSNELAAQQRINYLVLLQPSVSNSSVPKESKPPNVYRSGETIVDIFIPVHKDGAEVWA